MHRPASLRARITLGASVVVAVALLAGGLVFLSILERALTDSVRASLRARASDLASLADVAILADQIATESSDEEFLQLLDGEQVVAASAMVRAAPVLAAPAPGTMTPVTLPHDDERFLAHATEVAAGDRRLILIVGQSVDRVAETTSLVGGLLGMAFPLAVGLVAGTTWIVVGRALGPVERVRREVATISAVDLHRRLREAAGSDEITRLTRTMNDMLDRLEVASRRQRELVADTSHELRSPLAAIRQDAEVARLRPDLTTVPELADAVLAEAARLQRLVDDLLLLARAEEHRPPDTAREVDLDDVVRGVASRLRQGGGVAVDTSGIEAVRVIGDEPMLRRAVQNIVDNARRHASGRVAVTLRAVEDVAVLVVDDDGPGIPAADRDRIFERFVRLDEARSREAGGVGLGLAIVASVVRSHGGTVTVLDGPLGGARFEVRIPARRHEE